MAAGWQRRDLRRLLPPLEEMPRSIQHRKDVTGRIDQGLRIGGAVAKEAEGMIGVVGIGTTYCGIGLGAGGGKAAVDDCSLRSYQKPPATPLFHCASV